jgi:hypothetical protein
MFLVPGLIIAVIIAVVFGGLWLFGGSRTPEAFLKKLDDENVDVRWRTASDLAQTLRRDQRLASDPEFALQLALRLRRSLAGAESGERALAGRLPNLPPEERRKERKPYEAERTYQNFLVACLGNFVVPAGVPQLKEVAVLNYPAEPMARALLRRQAVWGLANAGNNLTKFDELAEPDQSKVLAGLARAADNADLADWAQATRAYLNKRRAKEADAFGVDVVLEKCGDDPDPGLRQFVTLAANFWYGTPEQNKRIDDTLLRLARGRGDQEIKDEEEAARWFEDNPDPTQDKSVCKKPGLEVRLNALLALARRGSPLFVPAELATLLNVDDLRQSFVIRRADKSESPDDAKVAMIASEAKKAVQELEKKRPDANVSAITAAIEKIEATVKGPGAAPATGPGTAGWLLIGAALLVLAVVLIARLRR